MKKNTKIILGIVAVGITATAGYFIYKRIKKKRAEKNTLTNIPNERIVYIQQNPVNSTTNPPTTNEISSVVANNPSTMSITNTAEGNAFRGWINDTYPAYAKEIDLDRTGSYNNSYITKAWKKYGTQYAQANASALTPIANHINTIANTTGVNVQESALIQTATNNPVFNTLSALGNKIFGQTAVPTATTGFDASVSAENLYRSMKGWGTNEKLFFDTLTPLTTAQRIQVKEYYDKNGVGRKLGTLETSIRGDFSGSQLNKALQLAGV